MAGPARTITPAPRRNASRGAARTVSELGNRSDRQSHEQDMILSKVLDGKLNTTGDVTLETGGATTTDIVDERIGTNTVAILVPLNQDAAASLPSIAQSVPEPGRIELDHAASGLTRSFRFILIGIVALLCSSSSAWAASPSLVGRPYSSDPTCSAGEYYLAVLTTGAKWRKCENGVWSDIGATAGAGEANTASNLGGGLANWDSKSGVDLRFNSFNASHFDLASNLISADEAGLEALLDLSDLAGLLPLSKLTDDATSGLCLLSGGSGGDPAYGACPGATSATVLDQAVTETDLRYDSTQEGYYYDVDGDSTHDTGGTEDYLDLLTIEVPGDYANVQAAIDSNDCKKGSTTANQGCRIVVAPGTYAEVFEIGSTGTTSADYQNSIVVEGAGFMGAPWTPGGNQSCVVTFTGNDVLNHDTISVNGSIGWSIRNLCIDMDASATNDTRYGIAIGTHGAVTKHGVVENVAIFDEGASGGAGIMFAGANNYDTAFNTLRNVYIRGVRRCVESAGNQTVSNMADNVTCSSPTGSIGGFLVTSGQLNIRRPYLRDGADNQILIQIGSEAYNSDIYDPTFEVTHDNVTFIKYPNDASSGQYRVHNILGGRFQPLSIPTVKHICIDWNRRGQLNVSGVSFESTTDANRKCEVNAANPHATQKSEINWVSNDVVWGAGTAGIVQPAMVFNESTVGGQMAVYKHDQGSTYIGQNGTISFEGSALDDYETAFSITNPTVDRSVTIPDADSSTVQAKTCSGTDKVSAISSAGVVTCTTDGGGGGSLPVVDTTTIVVGSGDATKAVRIEADGIATGTTRVITMPNFDVNLGAITSSSLSAGSVGTSQAAALDAGDTTTGTFGDARIDGSLESDEITGLTDLQISNTLTSSIFSGTGSTSNAVDLATGEVSGTLPVANGGTGATTLTTNALLKGAGTSAVASSGVTVDSSNNIDIPGNATIGGSSGASTFTMRNTADSGWVECGVVTTTMTCATDADGVPDGTL